MDQERPQIRREYRSVVFARLSVVLAGMQLTLLLLILGLSFSSHVVSANLSALYLLGEVVCAVVAIPLAIMSLRTEAGGEAGRRALFISIGVAAVCALFMVFPA